MKRPFKSINILSKAKLLGIHCDVMDCFQNLITSQVKKDHSCFIFNKLKAHHIIAEHISHLISDMPMLSILGGGAGSSNWSDHL